MNRRKLFTALGIAAGTLLVTVGVLAANDWFPKTDPMTGAKFGWFGKKLPKNSTASIWNPIPPPSPTPQLSKEYIYAGSRLLAVEDANAVAAPPADIAVWRPTGGIWCVMGQTGSAQAFAAWGLSTDLAVPGDYDGDGKTDLGIYRPSTGHWWIYLTTTNNYTSIAWGGEAGDIPVQADYDGDGKTDVAVARPNATESRMEWYAYLSGGGTASVYWGSNLDRPGVADFDGDGKADQAVYNETAGNYYWVRSSDLTMGTAHLAAATSGCDAPWKCMVSSDYDGDGKADPAIFNGSSANWYINYSTTGSTSTHQWGASGDFPVQNDYDGDGKTDLAVFNNASTAMWTIRRSSNNTTRTEYWGTTGDIPVPAFYRR